MEDKIFDLLNEVVAICKKENIKYFLAGELAYRIYKERELEGFYDATIMIYAADVKRFCESAVRREHRIIESLENHPRFPGFYLRYMDTETTLFPWTTQEVYQTNCIGINIEIICDHNRSTLKNRILSYLKSCYLYKYEKRNYNNNAIGRRRKYKSIPGRVLLFAIQTKKNMRKLFDLWLFQNENSETKIIAAKTGRQLIFMGELLSDDVDVAVGTNCYKMIDGVEVYLKRIYRGLIGKIKKTEQSLYKTDISWSVIKQTAQKENINILKAKKKDLEYQKWKKYNWIPIMKKRSYYYNCLFCSEDRIKLWKEYNDEKCMHICKLYQNNAYDLLEYELGEYLELIDFYMQKKMGLCFNPRIFEIAIKTKLAIAARDEGSEEEYKKLCKRLFKMILALPYQHFDDIGNTINGQRADSKYLNSIQSAIYQRIVEFADLQWENRSASEMTDN